MLWIYRGGVRDSKGDYIHQHICTLVVPGSFAVFVEAILKMEIWVSSFTSLCISPLFFISL